ncbi:MAG: hydrogenase nickel incorporation protein HypB [bacterium]
MLNSKRRITGRTLSVQRNALETNDIIANKNRTLFGRALVINFLSSPGSGKTSLLESLVPVLKSDGFKTAVIEGDVETDLDKKRIDELGVPAYQIITNGTCHLDAKMVNGSLDHLKINDADIIFIENVGNLVCPTSFNLGEDMKAVVLSITEGDDKPLKYPAAFYKSKVMIINKVDLLPVLDSDIAKIRENALSINKDIIIFETSCKKNLKSESCDNKGLAEFISFIKDNVNLKASAFKNNKK